MQTQALWYANVCIPTVVTSGLTSIYRPIDAYGYIYQGNYDGHVYAWDSTTGELKWTWYAGDSGYDTVYGSYPGKVIELVADGKVFINQGHTYNPPMFRGAHAVAINATTGETVWKYLVSAILTAQYWRSRRSITATEFI